MLLIHKNPSVRPCSPFSFLALDVNSLFPRRLPSRPTPLASEAVAAASFHRLFLEDVELVGVPSDFLTTFLSPQPLHSNSLSLLLRPTLSPGGSLPLSMITFCRKMDKFYNNFRHIIQTQLFTL